jgi:hypothetical protein
MWSPEILNKILSPATCAHHFRRWQRHVLCLWSNRQRQNVHNGRRLQRQERGLLQGHLRPDSSRRLQANPRQVQGPTRGLLHVLRDLLRQGVRPAEQQEEAAGAGGPQESGADRGHPRAAAELGGGCAEPDPVRHEHSHVR